MIPTIRTLGVCYREGMDTNDKLRRQAALLVKKGVSQKELAKAMHMPTSTFNKWLHKRSKRPADVRALDGLDTYVRELQAALQETPRVSSDQTTTAEGPSFRSKAAR
jgi:transcriptional regulator with XRE-family HTH domain